jgi:hypothetical protein
MRSATLFSIAILALGWISSCGVGVGSLSPNIIVTITNKPVGVAQGTSMVFNATVTGDPSNKGVTWTLSPPNSAGTLTNVTPFSVTYNAPATPPFPINIVTLVATSVTSLLSGDADPFSITVPGLKVTITNKISTINAGGSPITLMAQVVNDPRTAGVNWSLTGPLANCQGPAPGCGTLTNETLFSAVYTPPATVPSSPNNMPIIQANSMTDPTEFDVNTFTILPAPPSPATQFSVTAPASASTGTHFTLTVTALDASNNTATGYSGTVHFTSTDIHASLQADSTLTNGVGMFSATLNTIDSETITATDTATASISGTSSSIRVAAPQFQATGSMETPRVYNTATLLANGEVLIAGGSNGVDVVSSAELFNPQTGSFTPTGSMNTGRSIHTATLLQNGKVLITGGSDDTGPLATAELYDPSNGTFTPTGSMETARQGGTATLLNSGKVLVTGGLNLSSAVALAELYDPNSGTFTPTGNMTTTRYYHTAILLSDGDVLISGGAQGGGNNCSLVVAELYNSSNGTFKATGNMDTAQVFDAVTLLNGGNVLVGGGFGSCGPPLSTVELFDPGAGTFTVTGNMTTARARETATVRNNGTVLVTGGVSEINVPPGCIGSCQQDLLSISSAELFDPIAGTFAAISDMTTARANHTATLLNNGAVLITGGFDVNGNGLATAELYQ